jgi:hypothetical protein
VVPPEVFPAGQGAEDEEAEPSKLPQRAVRGRNRRMVIYVIRWKAPRQSAVWCSNAEIPRIVVTTFRLSQQEAPCGSTFLPLQDLPACGYPSVEDLCSLSERFTDRYSIWVGGNSLDQWSQL